MSEIVGYIHRDNEKKTTEEKPTWSSSPISQHISVLPEVLGCEVKNVDRWMCKKRQGSLWERVLMYHTSF